MVKVLFIVIVRVCARLGAVHILRKHILGSLGSPGTLGGVVSVL